MVCCEVGTEVSCEFTNLLLRTKLTGIRVAFIYEHIPWLSYYTKRLPGFGEDVKSMRAMGFARTEQRYTSGSTSRDLFYFLVGIFFLISLTSVLKTGTLQSNEDGAEKESPSRSVVISDGVTALVAGSDTTTTVLTSTLYCLLRTPEAWKRLQAEVDKFYPPGENSLDPKHYPEMHYMEAVM